jgi:hypothetical protein
VAQLPEPDTRYDVVCPHCSKPFTATLMTGGTARHHGFKCPHCRLFVPYERADERDLIAPTDQ